MTAMPTVPPRPSRSHGHDGSGSSSAPNKVPHVPPRPICRLDRSTSPHRFARSPLNEAPIATAGNARKSSLFSTENANNSGSDLTRQLSNNPLPDVGQEGAEYAAVYDNDESGNSPAETRGIGEDVKLQAPKPSLPATSAKQRVSAITRTDSSQAAAFGIGKAGGDTPATKSLKSKASFASNGSNGASEFVPASYESESGIPEIGQRVPMYPDAGDVQAPSPGPGSMPYTPGIGFFNDGSKTSSQHRRQSGVGFEVPPEAYGLHGHGVLPHDRLEKAYYEKHPELLKKEIDPYHERSEWAMSSEDLNRIVRETASRGAGLGTSPHVMSTPSEQVGFMASEEYTSRMNSPKPSTAGVHADSSSRKQSSQPASPQKARFESALSRGLRESEQATNNETGDPEVIIVNEPEHRIGKIYGGNNSHSTESLEHDIGGDGSHEEHVYTAPILAEDEVAKDPRDHDLQPAVSPAFGSYNEGFYSHKSSSGTSLPGSHSNSRPASTYDRKVESTPLDDVEEYEPLFPDDKPGKDAKPMTLVDKLKRPEHRRFPSQDVWEDTPNSLQYTATVSSPQLPQEENTPAPKPGENENIGRAFAKLQEELAEQESKSPDSFLGAGNISGSFDNASSLHSRQHSKQRFPSRDIWEDTPDSLQLQTTVGSPQTEKPMTVTDEPAEITSKPEVPERPQRAKPTATAVAASPPKPKPQIPAPPTRAKPVTRESSENVPLAKVTSNSSARSTSSDHATAAASKPKPPIPTRPVGSKIAALQGGFMADLNKRLKLGPQAGKQADEAEGEKEVEKEKDAKPLADARKGRARGPPRKAPAKAVEPVKPERVEKRAKAQLGVVEAVTWWEVDPDMENEILVGGGEGKMTKAGDVSPKEETKLDVVAEKGDSLGLVGGKDAGDALTKKTSHDDNSAETEVEKGLVGTNTAGEDTKAAERKPEVSSEATKDVPGEVDVKQEPLDMETGDDEVLKAETEAARADVEAEPTE